MLNFPPEVKIQNSKDILQYLQGFQTEESMIYLAGSILEGFGNKMSDVDVYVICEPSVIAKFAGTSFERESLHQEGQCLVHNIVHEGVRYDIEYWTWDDCMQMIERLNKLDFKTDGRIGRLSATEVDFLHRLKYGKPISNDSRFDEIYQNVQFANLGFYLTVIGSEVYQGCMEDLQGAYLSEDWGSAFHMSRLFIDEMVFSYLAANGETNPSRKWLYRKLDRYQKTTSDKELMTRYFELQTVLFHEDTIKKYVQDVIQFCQQLNIKAQSLLREKQIN